MLITNALPYHGNMHLKSAVLTLQQQPDEVRGNHHRCLRACLFSFFLSFIRLELNYGFCKIFWFKYFHIINLLTNTNKFYWYFIFFYYSYNCSTFSSSV